MLCGDVTRSMGFGRGEADAAGQHCVAADTRVDAEDALFGPCNKKFMLAAAGLYAGFAALDTVFDSGRLRAEGMPAAPRFTDYLHVCEKTSAVHTIADQGTIDFAKIP